MQFGGNRGRKVVDKSVDHSKGKYANCGEGNDNKIGHKGDNFNLNDATMDQLSFMSDATYSSRKPSHTHTNTNTNANTNANANGNKSNNNRDRTGRRRHGRVGSRKDLDNETTGDAYDYDSALGRTAANGERSETRMTREFMAKRSMEEWSSSKLIGSFDLDGDGEIVNVNDKKRTQLLSQSYDMPNNFEYDGQGIHAMHRRVSSRSETTKNGETIKRKQIQLMPRCDFDETLERAEVQARRRQSSELACHQAKVKFAQELETHRRRQLVQEMARFENDSNCFENALRRQETRSKLSLAVPHGERSYSCESNASGSGDTRMERRQKRRGGPVASRNSRFEPYAGANERNQRNDRVDAYEDLYDYGPSRGQGCENNNNQNHSKTRPLSLKTSNNNVNNNFEASDDLDMNGNGRFVITQGGSKSPVSASNPLKIVTVSASVNFSLLSCFKSSIMK